MSDDTASLENEYETKCPMCKQPVHARHNICPHCEHLLE
ncbi:zinc ribbon domain-containing protein [Haladaptatus caseinilyticus]